MACARLKPQVAPTAWAAAAMPARVEELSGVIIHGSEHNRRQESLFSRMAAGCRRAQRVLALPGFEVDHHRLGGIEAVVAPASRPRRGRTERRRTPP